MENLHRSDFFNDMANVGFTCFVSSSSCPEINRNVTSNPQ
jgi:hypothetical protein